MSCRRRCLEPDTGTAFPRMSEGSDANSLGEKEGRVSFSSDHSRVAVLGATSRSTCKEDMDEK